MLWLRLMFLVMLSHGDTFISSFKRRTIQAYTRITEIFCCAKHSLLVLCGHTQVNSKELRHTSGLRDHFFLQA